MDLYIYIYLFLYLHLFISIYLGTDVSKILLDEEPILSQNIQKSELSSENDIMPFLSFLESHIKSLMVIGSNEARVKELLDWVGSVVANSLPQDIETVLSLGSSLYERRKKLLQQIQKKQKSVVDRLRSLKGMENVSQLNSQRQAEFLKGVSSNSAGRSLARRALKVDDIDIDSVVLRETLELRKQILANPLPESKDDIVSFYGT